MRKWSTVFFSLMLAVSFSSQVQASAESIASSIKKRTLVFAAPMWEGYTHPDGSGLYWELLKEVYEPLGFNLRLKNMPWNRSMKLMSIYRTVDGVPGEGLDSEYSDLTFSKYPLEPEYLALISTAGKVKEYQESPDLTGLVVGMRKGYNLLPERERYGQYILKEFIDMPKGMALLEAGTIDVLVDEMAEIEAVARQEGIDISQFDTSEFVTGDYYFMVYGDTYLSQPLANIFDARIEDLAREQKLAALYEKWEVDMPAPISQLIEEVSAE